jgi:excisionase family DNA binding protein
MTKDPEKHNVYMNVPEASSYMRISERKVRELIATRQLKCVRIGRRVIIRRADIDDFMEQQAF